MDTVARSEMVEAELTRIIERRSRNGDVDVDEVDARWREGVRRVKEQERRQMRAEWYAYHAGQAERLRRTLEPLIAFHEARAQKLAELEPREPGDDAA